MPRPIWKGFITFGLVNIPVVLYSAEKKFNIKFNLIDSRDNARIRYVRVNEQTGEEVPWNAIAKGYEYEEGNFVLMKEEDFKEIAGENSKTINIENFVDKDSIDSIDFDKPYYLAPDKKGDKGYAILREVLNNTNKVGITKVMIHSRQYLAALMIYKDALILNLLHYHQEIRKPSEFELPSTNLKDYKISAKEMDVAKELVNLMTTKWKPEDYKDEFREAVEEYVEEKIHEKPHAKHKEAPVRRSNVTNFVDLLKKSLTDKKDKKAQRTTTKKKKVAHAKGTACH